MILFAWRYIRSGKLAWCLAAGAAVGLMQATKETASLSYVAAIGAFGLAWLYGAHTNPMRERGQGNRPSQRSSDRT